MAIIGPYFEQGYGADDESGLSREIQDLEQKVNEAVRKTPFGQRVRVRVGSSVPAKFGAKPTRMMGDYSQEAFFLTTERYESAGWHRAEFDTEEEGDAIAVFFVLVPPNKREFALDRKIEAQMRREQAWKDQGHV